MAENQNTRWWEFYGIRYAMGTVFGAVIVHTILSARPDTSDLLIIPKDASDFGIAHLTLLAAYGLAFCYVASAPVLVMHMARAHLWAPQRKSSCRIKINRVGSVLAPSVIVAELVWLFGSPWTLSGAVFSSVIGGFFLALAFQAVLLFRSFRAGAFRTIRYYWRLVRRRAEEDKGGYVETYRHLREHGNSFMIVFFEFWLGAILFMVISMPNIAKPIGAEALSVILLFLWTIPATAAWFVGQRLEHTFVRIGRRKGSLTKRST